MCEAEQVLMVSNDDDENTHHFIHTHTHTFASCGYGFECVCAYLNACQMIFSLVLLFH